MDTQNILSTRILLRRVNLEPHVVYKTNQLLPVMTNLICCYGKLRFEAVNSIADAVSFKGTTF